MIAPATGFLQSGQLDTQLLNGSPVLVLSHKSIGHPSLSLVPVPVPTTAPLPQEPAGTLTGGLPTPQLQKHPPSRRHRSHSRSTEKVCSETSVNNVAVSSAAKQPCRSTSASIQARSSSPAPSAARSSQTRRR